MYTAEISYTITCVDINNGHKDQTVEDNYAHKALLSKPTLLKLKKTLIAVTKP